MSVEVAAWAVVLFEPLMVVIDSLMAAVSAWSAVRRFSAATALISLSLAVLGSSDL